MHEISYDSRSENYCVLVALSTIDLFWTSEYESLFDTKNKSHYVNIL